MIVLFSCKHTIDKKAITVDTELEGLKTSIDSLFNLEIKQDEPGAALLVSHNGNILIEKGYGVQDLENNKPITKYTNFRIASVTKQFTALAVLSLVDKGKLSLNDTVYNIFPYQTFKDVTLQQLLNHTSGIADAESAFFKEWKSKKNVGNGDVLEWYSKENRKIDKPGEKYKYNNGAYEILPLIVEKISGQDFITFSKENVFEKAGMRRTNIYRHNSPIVIEEKAHRYERDSLSKWKNVNAHFLDGVLGAGGVYTSIDDYFQYDIALTNKTIFSNLSTHDLIFNPTVKIPDDPDNFNYAMGWFVNDKVANHAGSWFGANTFVKKDFKNSLTIAIFMNRNTLFKSGLIQKTNSLIYKYLNGNKAN